MPILNWVLDRSVTVMCDHIGLGNSLDFFERSTRTRPRLLPITEPRIVSRSIKHPCLDQNRIPKIIAKVHMLLRQNLTIKSHDHGKEGHFCNCRGISIHLPLTRGVQPRGQLSLYLLNDLSSLCSEFTIGIIAIPVGHL